MLGCRVWRPEVNAHLLVMTVQEGGVRSPWWRSGRGQAERSPPTVGRTAGRRGGQRSCVSGSGGA
eukprot:1221187-Alexandrium_andersonii.AAC.1